LNVSKTVNYAVPLEPRLVAVDP